MRWIYEQWLLWLASGGDERALRMLKVIYRRRSRREVRDLLETARLCESLGLDTAPLFDAWRREKLAVIEAWAA